MISKPQINNTAFLLETLLLQNPLSVGIMPKDRGINLFSKGALYLFDILFAVADIDAWTGGL